MKRFRSSHKLSFVHCSVFPFHTRSSMSTTHTVGTMCTCCHCDASALESPLLDWGSKQGHILSGGGRMETCFVPGRDYNPSDNVDLPHTLKSKGIEVCRSTFREWIAAGRRSRACVGAWSRPLFSGGWVSGLQACAEIPWCW